MANANVYAAITKRDAATRTVSGYVSSPDRDLDMQIVDPAWLAKALPPWLADWGNIREMHQARAVGTAQSVDLTTSPGPLLSAKIVDNDAWEKVEAGVYKGFSIGIKNPVVVSDAAAPRGRIVGGQLIEVSIVDRPANDAARFVLVKAAGLNAWRDVQSGAYLEVVKCVLPGCDCSCAPGAPDPDCDCDCDFCTGVADQSDVDDDGDVTKAGRTFSAKERTAFAASGVAMPGGRYPIPDRDALDRAIRSFGRTKAAMRAAVKAHIVKRAKALDATDLLPADWPGSTKTKETAVSADTTKAMLPGHPFDGTHEHDHSHDGEAHSHPHGHASEGSHDHEHTGGMHEGSKAVTPDVTKARMPKSEPTHAHPFKGTHNHEHDDQRGGTHIHAHLHDDDDMHDHPHLAGKDARMLSAEDRDQAQQLHGLYFGATPDVAKAASSVAETNVVAPVRQPVKIGSQLVTIMRDVAAQIEALANQTDQDRDGDVDFPANLASDAGPAKPAASFVQAEAPAGTPTIQPAPLQLSFSSEADLSTYVTAHVQAALAQAGVVTKDTVQKSLASVPEVAAAAAVTARGLAALADQTKAAMADLLTTKSALAETQAELERVKRLAAPIKGTAMAITKGVGLDADMAAAPGAPAINPDRYAQELVAKAASMTEAQRMDLGRMMVESVTRAKHNQ